MTWQSCGLIQVCLLLKLILFPLGYAPGFLEGETGLEHITQKLSCVCVFRKQLTLYSVGSLAGTAHPTCNSKTANLNPSPSGPSVLCLPTLQPLPLPSLTSSPSSTRNRQTCPEPALCIGVWVESVAVLKDCDI